MFKSSLRLSQNCPQVKSETAPLPRCIKNYPHHAKPSIRNHQVQANMKLVYHEFSIRMHASLFIIYAGNYFYNRPSNLPKTAPKILNCPKPWSHNCAFSRGLATTNRSLRLNWVTFNKCWVLGSLEVELEQTWAQTGREIAKAWFLKLDTPWTCSLDPVETVSQMLQLYLVLK